MFRIRTIAFMMLLVIQQTYAKTYYIQSAKELNALSLQPGDTVIMKDGVWMDQPLQLTGKGTEAMPIVLMSSKPGKVVLKGISNLQIDGVWLVVSGLYFSGSQTVKEDVVSFSDSSKWCRVTNTAIVDYNPSDKKTDNRYVSLRGAHNRVDHCFFKGKTNHGPTLVVWLSEKPNYHRIDHNHFGYRESLG